MAVFFDDRDDYEICRTIARDMNTVMQKLEEMETYEALCEAVGEE
jgi:hypothetical protein